MIFGGRLPRNACGNVMFGVSPGVATGRSTLAATRIRRTIPRETDMSNEESTVTQVMRADATQGVHLYMQTNEARNAIVDGARSAGGRITEVERVLTGGSGSGPYKPISDHASAPNAFEGAGSVILSADRRFLLTTNGGDNSVPSFTVGADGKLKTARFLLSEPDATGDTRREPQGPTATHKETSGTRRERLPERILVTSPSTWRRR
ncbi:hypothetical protein [Pseudonocardia alaniniphila]|uniref:Uncharacterized protein n=2 Tax=Pseudonocardia alaniniphila TaxID=75291 RepID=A0ABS9TV40_9PSEU|nr:hypothetical protein [Pseudonocardia alaniniphila]